MNKIGLKSQRGKTEDKGWEFEDFGDCETANAGNWELIK